MKRHTKVYMSHFWGLYDQFWVSVLKNSTQKSFLGVLWFLSITRVRYLFCFSMFDAFPDSKQYFPKFSDVSSIAAFRSNILLRAHSIHVITMIDQVVKSMHNRSMMDAIIIDAGKRHFDRNVTVELLKVSYLIPTNQISFPIKITPAL